MDEDDPNLGLGGSAYLQNRKGIKNGTPPRCDLKKEKAVQDATLDCIRAGWVKSAHDCSEGGLAVTLAECCFTKNVALNTPRFTGAQVDLSALKCARKDALLFGETQSRIVLSASPANADNILAKAKELSVPAAVIGKVTGSGKDSELSIRLAQETLSWNVSAIYGTWWNAIGSVMDAATR